MKRSPYSSYHGRGSWLRRILVAIVILLVIALAVALVGLFVLPNYIVYTQNGPQLVIPFFSSPQAPQTASPAPTEAVSPGPDAVQTPGDIVIEPLPSSTPKPSPDPTVDLSAFPRRDMPLGLRPLGRDETLGAGQGSLADMTDVDLSAEGDQLRTATADLPYAAAWLAPDWAGLTEEELTRQCLELSACGFDEIVFSEYVPTGDGKELAQLYRAVKAALDDAGWQGRLSLALDQALFDRRYDADLIPAVAQSFERLYFRSTLKAANKTALTNNGFTANGYTLVTVVKNIANLNYAWAVLPN